MFVILTVVMVKGVCTYVQTHKIIYTVCNSCTPTITSIRLDKYFAPNIEMTEDPIKLCSCKQLLVPTSSYILKYY